MSRGLLVALAVSVLSAAEVRGQQAAVVGTWKLVSYVTETPGGIRTYPLGEQVTGVAIYTSDGHVSIQFMRNDRPRFASGDAWRGTLEEERAAFEGFFSYAGRYTVDAARSTVTHHIAVSSAPNYTGIDLRRTFSFAGNRLILKTPQRQLAGQTSASTLIWERIH